MTISLSKSVIFFLGTLSNLAVFVIAGLIIANLCKAIKAAVTKEKFSFYFLQPSTLLVILCFSFLGLSIGLLVGLSQSPVVNVTIPALFTFYSGFITYLFAKDAFKDDEGRLSVLLSAIAVSCFLIYGVELGSREKNAAIQSAKKFDLWYMEEELKIRYMYKEADDKK